MSQGVCNPVEFKFVCPLPNGLHARPASQLAEFAGGFTSDLSLTNLRTGAAANLKSTLAIISADVRKGDECAIRITGADEESASMALRGYIEQNLPLSDQPLDTPDENRKPMVLPRALSGAAISWHYGLAVSAGIGKGKAVVIGGMRLPEGLEDEHAEDQKREERKIERALAAVRERIKGMLSRSISSAEAGVLKAHLAILDDVSLSDKVSQLIADGRSAGQALIGAAQHFISTLQQSTSAYIRDRAVDLQEICLRVLEELYGSRFTAPALQLSEPSVLVAETLAPQQLLSFASRWLQGIVLEYAGTTSHTVILARSLGIPTVVGVKDAPVLFSQEHELVVDANRGLVIPNGTAAIQRFYDRERRVQQARRHALVREGHGRAATRDSQRLEVSANVSSAEEAIVAFASGAESIGLFRTEMLFIGREEAPDEEEQFSIYREVARSAGQRPVIIRTIDIGGDKPVPHLNLPAESNPYLGFRGMRIYQEHRDLFRAQLRALLRASAFGRIQMMAPMVSTIEEVLWLKAQVSELKQELTETGVPFDPKIPLGIMIEVPSIAFILDQLCAELDFFSIGTNDLNQYFLAVDRDNAKVAGLSRVHHPSFLRFLRHIVDGVHEHGKWVGMCGEMAGDPANLPILIGLGLDEISAASPQIPILKQRIAELSAAECRLILDRMTSAAQVKDVEMLLAEAQSQVVEQPLLSAELVIVGSDSETKEEAIRELVDALYMAGRTQDPDRLEEIVWQRESAYSTGLGHGFAIPHCRSDAINGNSIAVLKLSKPVEWAALDGKPVSMVILLAVRESDANNSHMQVLAKLARRLMNESFRQQLGALQRSPEIMSFLSRELDLAV
ncbi:MAG TPA: phosphoenolpyruvate--protein phosphotransferase [Candidatus Sulfotelmatobacter sp.]|nr:phosphoenolpyruvate--protein phosphotransferase [Candidatus Sulfotelmatobacter sp.]